MRKLGKKARPATNEAFRLRAPLRQAKHDLKTLKTAVIPSLMDIWRLRKSYQPKKKLAIRLEKEAQAAEKAYAEAPVDQLRSAEDAWDKQLEDIKKAHKKAEEDAAKAAEDAAKKADLEKSMTPGQRLQAQVHDETNIRKLTRSESFAGHK